MVEPRMKFTTGRPKPRFASAVPVMVKLAGGLARSTVLGLMALTLGTGRESVIVTASVPSEIGGAPGRGGEEWAGVAATVRGAEDGTRRVAVPLSAVARTCASMVESRMKFTTGRPKPRFASVVPVMVKLAGGLARSTVLGLMALTLGTGRESVIVTASVPS